MRTDRGGRGRDESHGGYDTTDDGEDGLRRYTMGGKSTLEFECISSIYLPLLFFSPRIRAIAIDFS
jgi:hypothetical protein